MNKNKIKEDIDLLKDLLQDMMEKKRELNQYITEIKKDIDYHYHLLNRKKRRNLK